MFAMDPRRKTKAGSRSSSPPVNVEHQAKGMLGTGRDKRRLPLPFTVEREVDAAVNGPDCGDSQGQVWFHLRAVTHEWSDEVERHANQVCDHAEYRNHHVLQKAEIRVAGEAEDAGNAAEPVEQERPEVRGQRDRYQRIRQSRHFVMRQISEA